MSKIAEIDVSGFNGREIGIIVRRGGWHERDLHFDRYYKMSDKAITESEDIYLVQDTAEIFYSIEELRLSPDLKKQSSKISARFLFLFRLQSMKVMRSYRFMCMKTVWKLQFGT